jgi:hypothetical protein
VSDISETSPAQPAPIGLLLKAIKSLAPDEQDIVLGHLLAEATSPIGGASASGLLPPIAFRRPANMLPDLTLGTIVPIATRETELRTVPIRFPLAQYELLKQWCEDKNFPMAVVVRGLVERFLEQQPHVE